MKHSLPPSPCFTILSLAPLPFLPSHASISSLIPCTCLPSILPTSPPPFSLLPTCVTGWSLGYTMFISSPHLSMAPLCPCLHDQMVSLLHLAEITEEGVTFQSPVDGSRMLLTPEQSIQIQNRLGESVWACVGELSRLCGSVWAKLGCLMAGRATIACGCIAVRML